MEAVRTGSRLDICTGEDSKGNISTRRLEAVFCDLDGVLVNSEPFKFEYYVQAMVRQGVPWGFLISGKNPNGLENENFYDFYRRECVGASGEENAKRQLEWLKQNGIDLGMSWQEFRNERMRYYKTIEDGLPLIEKNIELIKRLKQGYPETPVYIVSRTDEERTRKILRRAGLESNVEVAVVPEKDRKKYSRAVEEAQRRELRLKDCLAMEDSLKGAREAEEYGLQVVAVPTEFTMLQFKLANSKNYLNPDSAFRQLGSGLGRGFVYFNPDRLGYMEVSEESAGEFDKDFEWEFGCCFDSIYKYNPEKDEWEEITEDVTEGRGYRMTGRKLARSSEFVREYEKERRLYVLSQVAKLQLS